MRAFKRLLLSAVLIWLSGIALTQASLYLPFRLWASGELRWIKALDGHVGCRIYLVGSSAVLYGLSAEQIAAATGCGVINTALAGIGAQVTEYLALVLKRVRPGDVVVLSDRDWLLSQDGVERRCRFEESKISWISLPRLAPNLSGLIGLTTGVYKTAHGDLAVYPPNSTPQRRLSVNDVKTKSECRLRVLQYQLEMIVRVGAVPLIAPPPMLTSPNDLLALQAELQTQGEYMSSGVAQVAWVPPWVESDSRLFTLEGQHASAAGRLRWTNDIVNVLRGGARLIE